MSFVLRTARLELAPATLEIVIADLHCRERLSELLRAELGEGWPPPLYDVRAMEWMKRSLQVDPALGAWTAWYWIQRRPRILIGLSGFKSRPVNGAVEISYSALAAYQRRGFATEAIAAMVNWAFANGAECVVAETLPELSPSQRTLMKNGFRYTGEGSEPGVMRYERWRVEDHRQTQGAKREKRRPGKI
ncbi:MAG TPA: GNAT family N-acetyltransferase [Candidatus Limnocylindria bacterium]|nr:GNAT family N-acetyltransferase [Candidatus Limnocylindria bacterium]